MLNYVKKIRSLFRTGFFHIFGSSVINKIISFLSSIVLVRILTKSEYGLFAYVWNIYSILLLFNGLGLESSMLQLCSENGDDIQYINRICRYSLKLGLYYDLVISLILMAIGLFIPLKINGSGSLLLTLCMLPGLQYVFCIILVYLRSQKRNKEYARINICYTVSNFFGQVCGAILYKEKGMILGSYAGIIISIGAALFCLKEIKEVLGASHAVEPAEKRALLSIGIVSMLNNGISQMMYLLDVFVIGIVAADETILAAYKVATVIPTALTFIPASLVTYIYPYFAEHRNDGAWCLGRYKIILKYFGLLNMCISGILVVLAPHIIPIIFGIKYNDAETILIFRLLAVNYFFSGTFRVIAGNLLVTQRKLRFNSFVAIVSGGINVTADFIFISKMGARGAAVATILVVVFSAVMNTSYIIYTFKKNINSKCN